MFSRRNSPGSDIVQIFESDNYPILWRKSLWNRGWGAIREDVERRCRTKGPGGGRKKGREVLIRRRELFQLPLVTVGSAL